ncbi:MAG: hypothetical protein U0556_12510 [Dehalococcoidia bacterium]
MASQRDISLSHRPSRRTVLGASAAAAGLILASRTRPAAAAPIFNNTPDATLRLTSGIVGRSSPAFFDLDGDGRSELIFGTTRFQYIGGSYQKTGQAKLIALRSTINGNTSTLALVAEQSTIGPINGAVSVAALQTVGDPHVLVPVGGEVGDSNAPDNGMHCYRFNRQTKQFQLLWNASTGRDDWPQGVGDGVRDPVYGSATLASRYQTQALDVTHGGWDRWIYQYNLAGQKNWEFNAADSVWSTAAIGDLSTNTTKSAATVPGRFHFFIGQDIGPSKSGQFEQLGGGFLNALKPDGVPLWRNFYEDTVFCSPAVADIDGDGDLEVVFTTGPYYYENPSASRKIGEQTPRPTNYLICLSALTGKEKWKIALGGFGGYSSPALANLKGKKSPGGLPTYQIAVAFGTGATQNENSQLLLVDSDGTVLWSRRPVDENNKTDGLRNSPVIAGGRIFQAVDWGVAEFDADGNQITTYHTNFTVQASPVVADLDGDGLLELYVVGANLFETRGSTNATNGWVYKWVLRNLKPTIEWPMFHLDSNRTGYIAPIVKRVTMPTLGAPLFFSARTTTTKAVAFRFRVVLPPGTPAIDTSTWLKVTQVVDQVTSSSTVVLKIEIDASKAPPGIPPGTPISIVLEPVTDSGQPAPDAEIVPASVEVLTPSPFQTWFFPFGQRSVSLG